MRGYNLSPRMAEEVAKVVRDYMNQSLQPSAKKGFKRERVQQEDIVQVKCTVAIPAAADSFATPSTSGKAKFQVSDSNGVLSDYSPEIEVEVINHSESDSWAVDDYLKIHFIDGKWHPYSGGTSGGASGGGGGCCCAEPLTGTPGISSHPHLDPAGDTSAFRSRVLSVKCGGRGGAFDVISAPSASGDILIWDMGTTVANLPVLLYETENHTFVYEIPDSQITKENASGTPLTKSAQDIGTFTEDWAGGTVTLELGPSKIVWAIEGKPHGRYSHTYLRDIDVASDVQPNCSVCSSPSEAIPVNPCLVTGAPTLSATLSYTPGSFSFISGLQDWNWTADWYDRTYLTDTRVGDTFGVRAELHHCSTSFMTGSEVLPADSSGFGVYELNHWGRLDQQFVPYILDRSTLPSGCGISNRSESCRRPVQAEQPASLSSVVVNNGVLASGSINYASNTTHTTITSSTGWESIETSSPLQAGWRISFSRDSSTGDCIAILGFSLTSQFVQSGYMRMNDSNWAQSGLTGQNEHWTPALNEGSSLGATVWSDLNYYYTNELGHPFRVDWSWRRNFTGTPPGVQRSTAGDFYAAQEGIPTLATSYNYLLDWASDNAIENRYAPKKFCKTMSQGVIWSATLSGPIAAGDTITFSGGSRSVSYGDSIFITGFPSTIDVTF